MRWFLVIALFGCHPAGTSRSNALVPPTALPEPAAAPTREVSCTEALAAVVDYLGSASGKPVGDGMVAHCTADNWSADVRRCFTQQPGSQPQPCMDMLSNYQRQQLGEDLAAKLAE